MSRLESPLSRLMLRRRRWMCKGNLTCSNLWCSLSSRAQELSPRNRRSYELPADKPVINASLPTRIRDLLCRLYIVRQRCRVLCEYFRSPMCSPPKFAAANLGLFFFTYQYLRQIEWCCWTDFLHSYLDLDRQRYQSRSLHPRLSYQMK